MYVVMYIHNAFYFTLQEKQNHQLIKPGQFSFLPDIVIRREDNVSLYVDIDCIVYTGHWYCHTQQSRPPSYSLNTLMVDV